MQLRSYADGFFLYLPMLITFQLLLKGVLLVAKINCKL